MKNLYFLTVLFISLSCTQQTDSTLEIKKFKKEINLKTTEIKHDLKFGPHDIYMLNDSLALFYTLYDKDYCLRIVNINNLKLIRSAGIIGNGPGEIFNPGYIFIDEDKNIWLSSGGTLKIFKFPLDSILIKENYRPAKSIDLKGNIVINFTIKNDTLEYFNTLVDKQIMNKVEENGNTRKFIDKHIITTNKVDDMDLNFCYFKFHPTYEKFVIGYIHDDFLLIANSNGDIIRKIKGPVFIDPNEYIQHHEKMKKAAYQKIVVDDKYIYCLFRGTDKSTPDKNGRYVRNDAKTILIFNWAGDPVKRINLDRGIFNFEIDKKRNRFIAYSSECEDALISINYEEI